MGTLEHVGARIRLFRKHQNMTLEELAYLVHKSPSTLSKYEHGTLNIDIVTLFEIASALEIDISQLTDFSSGKQNRAKRSSTNFFGRYSRFFVYVQNGSNSLMNGMMEVTRRPEDSSEDNVVLFLNEGGSPDFNEPLFIYTGTMVCDDNYAYIDLKNASGMKDTLFILVKSPQWMRNSVKGLYLAVSNTYGCPYASMILFTLEKQKITKELMDDLRIDKDAIAEFAKQTNLLTTL